MVNIKDINLTDKDYNLKSKLIENLSFTFENYYDIKLPEQFSNKLINDFNTRNFNNNNINDILYFINYLDIDSNTAIRFVLNNLEKTDKSFNIDSQHIENFSIPEFITKGYDNNLTKIQSEITCDKIPIYPHKMEIIKYDLDKWLRYAYTSFSHQAFYDIKNGILMSCSKTCIYATKCGSIKCLKYLSTIPYFVIDNYALSVSVWENKYECLDFLYKQLNCNNEINSIIKKQPVNRESYDERYLYLMKSLYDNYDNSGNNLETIQLLHKLGCLFDADKVCKQACEYGLLEYLKFFINIGGKIDFECYEKAASNGHVKCLEYLIINGKRHWNIGGYYTDTDDDDHENFDTIYLYPVMYGHLDCIKILRKYDCPWQTITGYRKMTMCELAALNGHCECLKYLYENGCELGNVKKYIKDCSDSVKGAKCLDYINTLNLDIESDDESDEYYDVIN